LFNNLNEYRLIHDKIIVLVGQIYTYTTINFVYRKKNEKKRRHIHVNPSIVLETIFNSLKFIILANNNNFLEKNTPTST